jgi:tetratricopeptide (TPR) repeat protein
LWHVQGLIHRRQDKRELALPSLQRAAALAPQEPLILHGLARTLLEAGLPSVDAYANALRVAPGDSALLMGLVSALCAEGRADETIPGLERALASEPRWADGHALLSRLRWSAGERDGFTSSFNEALQQHPRDMELRRQQILTLLHAEQWDAMLGSIEDGRSALGDLPLFDLNEAVVHDEQRDFATSGPLLERFADADDSTVQIRRVRHLLRTGRVPDAVELIDRWLGHADQASFWPYAATAWRMTGDPRWDWLEGDERFVGVYDLQERLPPLQLLTSTLRELHSASGQFLEQSVRTGTQTAGNLFHRIDPVIVQLREAVRVAVEAHAARLPERDPSHPLLGAERKSVRFSGAWSVRLNAGGHHANHVHPLGWFSSALYIKLPASDGGDGAGSLTLGEPPVELDLDIQPFKVIAPRKGQLALFPSTMWHGTRPFSEGERITVAFDVARRT